MSLSIILKNRVPVHHLNVSHFECVNELVNGKKGDEEEETHKAPQQCSFHTSKLIFISDN